MSDLVWARRPERHTSPETYGTRCDRCPKLLCYEVDRARLHRWHYHCEAMARNLGLKEIYAMTAEECPEHRALGRKR